MRLPDCLPQTSLMILGQMEDVFSRAGYEVESWQPVQARARRRKFYFEAEQQLLAAYIASVSDIDDIIPALTAYQIEWNKIHQKLNSSDIGSAFVPSTGPMAIAPMGLLEDMREALSLSAEDFSKLGQIWPGDMLLQNLQRAADQRLTCGDGAWAAGSATIGAACSTGGARSNRRPPRLRLANRPIYFVSSNTHSIVNLISGAAHDLKDELLSHVDEINPEGLRGELANLAEGDDGSLSNLLYYVMRLYADHDYCRRMKSCERISHRERKAGVLRISRSPLPGCRGADHPVESTAGQARRSTSADLYRRGVGSSAPQRCGHLQHRLPAGHGRLSHF